MKTLLRIDSSFNTKNSYSRNASDYYVNIWKKNNPNGHVITRDIEQSTIPHLSQETYEFFKDSKYSGEKVLHSDLLIDELNMADEIIISCPVYNFSIPSKLKVYFDQIIRINRTFEYDSITLERRGLIKNKMASIIVARGGAYSKENGDGVEDYLKGLLNYIGIAKIKEFSISETAFENADKNLEEVKSEIENFFDYNKNSTQNV